MNDTSGTTSDGHGLRGDKHKELQARQARSRGERLRDVSAPEPVLSEEDRETLADRVLGGAVPSSLMVRAVEAIVARHVAAERERREQAEAEADRERRFAARVHSEVENVLNRALGPYSADGTGEGLAADVALVVRQRDEARAEVERLRERLVEAQDGWDALRAEAAALADEFDTAVGFRGAATALRALLTDPTAALRAVRAERHIVHVTAEPIAEDAVWCEECEEWVTTGPTEGGADDE